MKKIFIIYKNIKKSNYDIKKIYVTRPSLPSLKDLIPDLREVWNTRVLTNNEPYHNKLETELCEFLGISHI